MDEDEHPSRCSIFIHLGGRAQRVVAGDTRFRKIDILFSIACRHSAPRHKIRVVLFGHWGFPSKRAGRPGLATRRKIGLGNRSTTLSDSLRRTGHTTPFASQAFRFLSSPLTPTILHTKLSSPIRHCRIAGPRRPPAFWIRV